MKVLSEVAVTKATDIQLRSTRSIFLHEETVGSLAGASGVEVGVKGIRIPKGVLMEPSSRLRAGATQRASDARGRD